MQSYDNININKLDTICSKPSFELEKEMIPLTEKPHYPINLDAILSRINNYNGKKKRNHNKQYQYKLFAEGKYENVIVIKNKYGENIIRVEGDIPKDLPIKNKDRFLFISYDQSSLTHGLHKYPAKFFPELPRWLIIRYSKENDLILDPFTGSGTTNLEALLNRRNSVGIDVDPFSRFLSRVKVTPLNPKGLIDCKEILLDSIVNFKPSKVIDDDIPVFPYRDNWFNKDILLELAYLKKSITALDTFNEIKNFFMICFSAIIRAVSNADNNCTRTVIRKKLNKKVYPGDALKKFASTILINVPKMIEFSLNCPNNISVLLPEDMDAKKIKFNSEIFDLAVTSPPYANAVDYPRTHQLESYWLGLVNGSLAPLKKKHVGTESVSSNDYNDLHKIGVKEADKILTRIFEKDKRRSFIAYKYLKDMQQNMKEVHRVLKKGSRYIIVVGNNKIRGENFENWKYIMELASNIGFNIEYYFGSEIINHFIKVPREERINTDWVVILKK